MLRGTPLLRPLLLHLAHVASVTDLALLLCGNAFAEEVRTWTDSTGKFKIKGTFVSEVDGVVTLHKEDGEELEIPLKKLSFGDQKLILELKSAEAENPFKSKPENPFKSSPKNSPGKTAPADDKDADEPVGELQVIQVDWSDAEIIPVGAVDTEWSVTPPAPQTPLFEGKLKTGAIPAKSDFFEGINGLAINPHAKKAVVGYGLGRPGQPGATRVSICDLTTGKATAPASATTQMMPLALHSDGKTVLMRRSEFGFGNADRLELWRVKAKEATPFISFVPYEVFSGGARDVTWAYFLGDKQLLTNSRSGRVTLWDWKTATPVWYFETCDGAAPALSPDEKLLAFCTGGAVGILDLEKREVIARTATPNNLQWPGVAFSPSGKRLGVVAFDKVLCYDVATGKLEVEVPANGSQFNGPIDFPHDDYILANKQYLIDVPRALQLWHYRGADGTAVVGDVTFFAVTDGEKSAMLLNGKLPHPDALAAAERASKDPEMFIFREGSAVSIDVSGVPDAAQRTRVEQALRKQLELGKHQIQPDAKVKVVANVTGPKPRDISYFGSGDYKVQEWIAAVKIVHEGKDLWQTSGTNVPFFISLQKGENIEGKLRESEKPPYGIFDGVIFPKFVQKAGGGAAGSGQGQTIGSSTVSMAGVR